MTGCFVQITCHRFQTVLAGALFVALLFCWPVTSAGAAASPAFDSAVNYSVGTAPYTVASDDFNKDGRDDLVTANASVNYISVLLGNGDGTFATAAGISIGAQTTAVTTGDFNGDGNPDLAVADYGSNISILLGNGDGTFVVPVDYAVMYYHYSITSGDFNRDGSSDLAVTCAGGPVSSVAILLGVGDGTFGLPTYYAVGTGVESVAAGDFNRDGKTDLVTANAGPHNVSILLGVGDGTFAAAVNYSTGLSPFAVTTGDFNEDGKTDLATANLIAGGNNVSVLLGVGDGTFGGKVDYPAGSAPFSIVTGDFNGDGKADLATANYSGANISVLPGAGNGTFNAAVSFEAGTQPQSAIAADFNSDGRPDLAAANFDSDSVSVFINKTIFDPSGAFGSAVNFDTGTGPDSVSTGDFNRDGKADLVTANSTASVSILLGTGSGTFGAATNFGAGSSPYSVTTGDFNRDGKADLVTANNGSANVSILPGTGTGTFGTAVNYSVGTGPTSVTTGDFNRDGKADLAVANFQDDDVSILLGLGDGTFAAAADYGTGVSPTTVSTGDFNRDGKADLAVANGSSDNVSILLGVGDGTFGAAANYSTGVSPTSVISSDFNNDGEADLATANYNGNNVSILLGVGDGTFGAAAGYGAGTGSIALTAGDFDRDGTDDLAVANYTGNNLSVLRGAGDGTFSSAVNYSAGTGPTSLSACDFNRDGMPDLATANIMSNNASVYLNSPEIDYFWTWYDNVFGDDWVLMANPVAAPQDLTFSLSVGGVNQDLSGYNSGVVSAGQSITPIYSAVMDGPVKATSKTGGEGIVSQRTLWPKGGSSLEEVLGTEAEKLSNHFYWTWYDDLSEGYTNYVMVGNPGASTVYYRIKIAGQSQSVGSWGQIAPGQSAYWRDGAKQGGPVEVEAWSDSVDGAVPADVLASQRVLSNGDSAFNEVPGIPASELSGDYLWTWYDNHTPGAQNWIMIANPGLVDMHYEIWIGGELVQDDTTAGATIPPGGYIFPKFDPPAVPAPTGPVRVKTFSVESHLTAADSISSQRVIWGPSFEEVPGYPYAALTNSYHWTWYDQSAAGVLNWVMVSKQDFTATNVYYKVLVAGVERKACTQIPDSGRDFPAFPAVMDGPVQVSSYSEDTCTTPSAPGNGIMASQRVLWKGYFNETLGTIIS
ncbi:MAG: FG-GAP-like repeat-containing protein [Thermoleophilia bacterium]